MGRVYLLSSMVVPIPFECESATVTIEEVSVEEARAILEGGFISAVGHEATARFLSKILGIEVRPSREAVYLHEDDVAIAIQFGERIQRIELGEEEVERYFREGRARFLKITVDRLRRKTSSPPKGS